MAVLVTLYAQRRWCWEYPGERKLFILLRFASRIVLFRRTRRWSDVVDLRIPSICSPTFRQLLDSSGFLRGSTLPTQHCTSLSLQFNIMAFILTQFFRGSIQYFRFYRNWKESRTMPLSWSIDGLLYFVYNRMWFWYARMSHFPNNLETFSLRCRFNHFSTERMMTKRFITYHSSRNLNINLNTN